MVEYETLVQESNILTSEGLEILEKGSHEAQVFNAIPSGNDGISVGLLTVESNSLINQNILGNAAKFGQGAAFKAKWIGKGANGNLIRLVR